MDGLGVVGVMSKNLPIPPIPLISLNSPIILIPPILPIPPIMYISISRTTCFQEASRQLAYIAAQSSPSQPDAAEPIPLFPEESDEPLLQQFWEAACREADILLSRYRVGPCQGDTCHQYAVTLHMPPAFDPGLAPMLSGLLYAFFTAFLVAAYARTVLPERAHSLEIAALHQQQRLRDALHLRRLPIRRPPVF